MRMMIRRFSVWFVLLILGVATVGSQETLRITPSISDNHVVVSFELNDAYTDAVREAIASGLRTTFSYQLELRTPAWIDRTVGTTIVATTDQYDNLTRRHTLTRTIDGRVEDVLVTEDDAVVRTWLTKWTRVPVADTPTLDVMHDGAQHLLAFPDALLGHENVAAAGDDAGADHPHVEIVDIEDTAHTLDSRDDPRHVHPRRRAFEQHHGALPQHAVAAE